MKDFFLSKVQEKEVSVCHHAHFDKAYLISPETLENHRAVSKRNGSCIENSKRTTRDLTSITGCVEV